MLSVVSILMLLGLGAPAALAQRADTTPERVAQKQIETFNRQDIDGFMALYADDAVAAEFPSGKVTQQGKAAIRARYEALFKGVGKGLAVRVPKRVVDGAFVMDYEEWDAKPGERNHAVWMYEIRGGLIRRAWAVKM